MKDGSDGFLTRWARRKAGAKSEEAARQERAEVEAGKDDAEASAVEKTEPEFDITSLPSIDSLTKDSDFTAFMQKGVPAPLKKAALQKMWTSDPAIRDYIGLSEMSWDFNAPEAFPGYGALSPLAKVADMVRDIANGHSPPIEEHLEVENSGADDGESRAPEAMLEAEQPKTAATEQDERPTLIQNETEQGSFRPKRRHGGAIPR